MTLRPPPPGTSWVLPDPLGAFCPEEPVSPFCFILRLRLGGQNLPGQQPNDNRQCPSRRPLQTLDCLLSKETLNLSLF